MEKRELEEDGKKNWHHLDSSCSKFVPLVSNFKFSFGVYRKIHSTLTRPQRRDASLLRSRDFVAKKNIGSVRFGPGWTGSATSYHKENREPNPRFGSPKYLNLGPELGPVLVRFWFEPRFRTPQQHYIQNSDLLRATLKPAPAFAPERHRLQWPPLNQRFWGDLYDVSV